MEIKKDLLLQDEELVNLWKSGNFEAAEILYQRYEKKLLFFFYVRTRHYEDSRDLLGETFVRVAQNIYGFRMEASFKSWIFTIGRHLLQEYFYRKKRAEEAPQGFSLDVFSQESREEFQDLEKCMEELSPRSQTVLFLRYHSDYTLRELGYLLNLSHEAIHKIEEKSLDALRICLEKTKE